MFSKSVEYGINLLNNMPAPGEVESSKVLAKKGKIPAPYAAKIVQHLVKAGIVSSQRGVGGGVTLLKPLNKVSVVDVIDAVAGSEKPAKGTKSEKVYNELRKFLAKTMVK